MKMSDWFGEEDKKMLQTLNSDDLQFYASALFVLFSEMSTDIEIVS